MLNITEIINKIADDKRLDFIVTKDQAETLKMVINEILSGCAIYKIPKHIEEYEYDEE